ncbi:MAG TPA: hypothetical protein VM901_05900 [Bdellovibrionota bacterium]|jgi:Sec-independent protein translocase protein TatA|nr:hypothetical protein [Bdellovibrionota bacterium]
MELSSFEIVAVAIIALIVLGPEELVRVSRKVGSFLGQIRAQIGNFKVMVEQEIDEKARIESEKINQANSTTPKE